MAKELDLQEQEQLDELKAFWKQYGNLITWTLTLALAAYAAWQGWNWYQREQAVKAGAVYDELDRAAQAGDADRAERIFEDLKSRYPRTAFAEHGALAVAKVQHDKGKLDAAKAALRWAAGNAAQDEVRTVARLRLAGILLEAKQFDEALELLGAATAPGFEALVADRRGDVLAAAGKPAEARAAYEAAWKAMGEKVEYRRLIGAKLTAMAAPPAAASAPAEASK
jgi:predicted negative regulator of RcsB-dependent stress response